MYYGKYNESQTYLVEIYMVEIKPLYIVYRHVFALVEQTFFINVVYTSLISRYIGIDFDTNIIAHTMI
jgi:hypothetical protein